MSMRVYPLYPHVKRYLLLGTLVYLILVCAYSYGAYRQYQHPEWSVLAIIGFVDGFCAVWGLLLCVHLLVLGVPAPEGMTPVAREDYPGRKYNWWRRIQHGDDVKLTGLAGDEAQPIIITAPIILILLTWFFPAVLVFLAILKFTEAATTRYLHEPRAYRPLGVLLSVYVVLSVIFGVIISQMDTDWQGFVLVVAALCSSLIGGVASLIGMAKMSDWTEDCVSVIQREICHKTLTWLRVDMHMHAEVFRCMVPILLVCLSLHGMWLLEWK